MTSPPRKPRTDLYRAHADAPRTALGRGSEATYDPLRRRTDVLSAAETAVFAACRRWGTLDELTAHAMDAGAGPSRAAIRGTLNDLVERGVLASEAEIAGVIASGQDDEPAPKIATLGIPTRERPSSLRRALATYGADIAAHGRDIDILVLDDAAGADAAARARALAREAGERLGVRVRFADRHEKARFADELARLSGAPSAMVRRALAPEAGTTFAAGAARNLLLLDSVGQCSLQVDDDTRCEPRPAPSARDGLVLRSFDDPTEMWFDEAALRPADASPGDGALAVAEASPGYAALHERLLGRRAGALVASALAGEGADPSAASTHLLARIAAGGRVVCTQLGVHGDSAMGATGYLLTIGQPSRGRLLASQSGYRRAIESRRLVRAVPAATLTEQELCMTFAIGLDGRAPLPPFPALDRNEDGLFGAVLLTCDPGAVLGHLPWTVGHEPEDARATRFDVVFDQVGRVGINDLIGGLVSLSRAELDLRTPCAAFETLGRSLIAWSEVPAPELFERISWLLARRLAQRLGRIDTLLRESRRAPPFWASDLERLADTIRERVEEPERALPMELVNAHTPEVARALASARVREHGELLLHWPALLDAARTLRERGVRLGETRLGEVRT